MARKIILEHQVARAEKVFRGRMGTTPFLNHPAFKYDLYQSSFKGYVFGAKAGPDIELENIFHEIGHAIEFVLTGQDIEDRCGDGEFYFALNEIELGGAIYHNLETTQCTEREIRAFAIQIKFMHSIGFKKGLKDFALHAGELAMWLPDFLNIEVTEPTDAIRKQWVVNKVLAYYQSISTKQIFDAFLKWLDVIQTLKNED